LDTLLEISSFSIIGIEFRFQFSIKGLWGKRGRKKKMLLEFFKNDEFEKLLK
jgi:hypothetical protein